MRTALTIAGSDPSAGAGIQADLKTFAAHGVYGVTAITAITVQNTLGVHDVMVLPAPIVAAQINVVLDDLGADTVKIGMLGSAEIAAAVADILTVRALPHVVLDTVLGSTGGVPLLDRAGVDIMRRKLFPLARLVTTNTAEAEVLGGLPVTDQSTAREAARRLFEFGPHAVIVKGGHLPGLPVDVLYDGTAFTEFSAARVMTRQTHGTGCTFASAIAARLALGDELTAAVSAAKQYVTDALTRAPGLGRGHGPLAHFPS
jgi:hydroxymethylpyrimidine/phosphomethylpyrimidine kinase